MSGLGERFVRAGYKDPKPLIMVDGQPIIAHVVDLFPGEKKMTFICNTEHLATTLMGKTLHTLVPSATIVPVEKHKYGPVYAVLAAAQHIDDEEPVIISYCDYSLVWTYADFKKTVEMEKWDGAIICYKGFHPHHLGSTYYGYVRVTPENEMIEIQEKKPFTDKPMNEYAAAGMYYFKKGAFVKKYFQEAMDQKLATNGEYYASLPFNLMQRDGLHTFVYEVPYFLQWGTPEDLAIYRYWSEYFHTKGCL